MFNSYAVGATLNLPLGNEFAIFYKILLSAPDPKATEWNSILFIIPLIILLIYLIKIIN